MRCIPGGVGVDHMAHPGSSASAFVASESFVGRRGRCVLAQGSQPGSLVPASKRSAARRRVRFCASHSTASDSSLVQDCHHAYSCGAAVCGQSLLISGLRLSCFAGGSHLGTLGRDCVPVVPRTLPQHPRPVVHLPCPAPVLEPLPQGAPRLSVQNGVDTKFWVQACSQLLQYHCIWASDGAGTCAYTGVHTLHMCTCTWHTHTTRMICDTCAQVHAQHMHAVHIHDVHM